MKVQGVFTYTQTEIMDILHQRLVNQGLLKNGAQYEVQIGVSNLGEGKMEFVLVATEKSE